MKVLQFLIWNAVDMQDITNKQLNYLEILTVGVARLDAKHFSYLSDEGRPFKTVLEFLVYHSAWTTFPRLRLSSIQALELIKTRCGLSGNIKDRKRNIRFDDRCNLFSGRSRFWIEGRWPCASSSPYMSLQRPNSKAVPWFDALLNCSNPKTLITAGH